MRDTSAAILERFRIAHGKDINLSLRTTYTDLLEAFNNPQNKLPPAIIVAGTNGKGSTCAFLRAFLEAAGKKVHVYTSPHLITFHERIRLSGKLIEEDELCSILKEIEAKAAPGGLSLFEAQTAAAFIAFTRHEADVVILEVGLGGRLDATNVIANPIASVITRLSFDHCEFLGHTMTSIAREKAGILRTNTPCFIAPQPSQEAFDTLCEEAKRLNLPAFIGKRDWEIVETDTGLFSFSSRTRSLEDLPIPALFGKHQLWNAGLAIAALDALPFTIPTPAIHEGLRTVDWPGRLQQIKTGILLNLLPQGSELWLDGGHNDSAGEVLAAQCSAWKAKNDLPNVIVFGMLSTKDPETFIEPITPHIAHGYAIPILSETNAFTPHELVGHLSPNNQTKIEKQQTLQSALKCISTPSRVLICGSLYLAGQALKENDGQEALLNGEPG